MQLTIQHYIMVAKILNDDINQPAYPCYDTMRKLQLASGIEPHPQR